MPAKFSDRSGGEWFDLWRSGKDTILRTMVSNLHADLEAGYQPTGDSVGRQLATIADYRNNTNVQIMRLLNMTPEARDRWCFDDMLKHGTIT